MQIIKRDGRIVDYDGNKIISAIIKAMTETQNGIDMRLAKKIEKEIKEEIKMNLVPMTVENIQDLVEDKLMSSNRKDVAKKYILYRENRNKVRNSEWVMTDLQKDIWKRKYEYKNEGFENFLNRVSGDNERIKKLIREKKFIPAGRILANRGLYKEGKKITYSNCYVITPPKDNIESIFDTAKKLARTYSYGGGCGVDISKLRPRNAKVNNAANTTTGSVSFMDLYSLTTELIGQRGRRGALMISIDCNHPDLEEFINVKNDLNKVTKANISIKVTDEFMKAVKDNRSYMLEFYVKETGEKIERIVNAREIFKKIAYANWDMAEPGLLFWDRIKSWNLLSEDKEFEYVGLNPCVTGDTLILTDKGYKRIDELINKTINIWNGFEFSMVQPKITGYNQPIITIEFSDGSILNCTKYHKFHLNNGEIKEAKDLKIGDKIIKCNYPIIEGTNELKIDCYTQGFYSGDGTYQKNRDRKFIYLFDKKKDLFPYLDYITIYNQENSSNRLALLIDKKYLDKDFVPNSEFKIKDRINWLAGLIDSDGYREKSGSIQITSINKDFLLKVKYMLNTLGCNATISINHKKGKKKLPDGNGKYKEYNTKTSYRLLIPSNDVIQLIKLGLKTYRINLDNITPNRDARRFIKVKKIIDKNIVADKVYCFNEPKKHTGIFNGIITGQCAEEPLPAGGSCLLGSINLSEFIVHPFTNKAYFDFDKFEEVVKDAVVYLNEVLDEGLELHPLDEQKNSVYNWRQIGLGVMAIADMLIKLGIKYGSHESLIICDEIAKTMINSALQQSALLAKKYGAYPKYKAEAVLNSPFLKEVATKETYELIEKYGLRNSQLLTIAPTGSISTMLGVSGGIEPIFNLSYTRKVESLHDEDTYYKVYTPIVKEYMEFYNIEDEENLPDYFVTAMKLNYKQRINMQAVWQKYIDASISSTINVPNNFTVEEVENLYLYAWGKGLKGVTLYRDGCRRSGILINNKKENNLDLDKKINNFKTEMCPECGGKVIETGGCKECLECGWSPCSI